MQMGTKPARRKHLYRVGQSLHGQTPHLTNGSDAELHPLADAASSRSSKPLSSSTSGFGVFLALQLLPTSGGGPRVLSQLTGEAALPKPAVGTRPPPWPPPSIGSAARLTHQRIQSIGWGSRLAFNSQGAQSIDWASESIDSAAQSIDWVTESID